MKALKAFCSACVQATRTIHACARNALQKTCVAALAAVLIFTPGISMASQLNLATAPLFLSAPVKPNIFFLSDDSGSMDWNLMTTENDGIMYLGGCAYFYTHPTPGISGSAIAPAVNVYTWIVATEEQLIANGVAAPYGGVWRAWNKDYSGMYYDPAVKYTPWEGVNVSGTAYSDAPAAAAPYNPFRPADGTINLTTTTSYTTDYCPSGGGTFTVSNFYPARHYTWTDSISNGVVDAADSHTLVEIKSTTTSYPKAATRTDCAGSTCTYAEEIQNFANWFSYYRKRDLTAKNAISKTVAPITSRVGYATLWNNSTVNNIQIALMNPSTLSGNKKTLLDGLFNTRPSGSTPLRRELDEAGKYYECVSGNTFGLPTGSPSCPILPAASGGNCQQNFTVLTTDGFYNDAFTALPGNDNVDADGNSPDAAGNTAFDGGAYADTYADTLADIAMHYYERDLSSTLTNNVPIIAGIDNAAHQHMVTYTVAFGVTGTLSAGPASGATSFAWPDPTAGDPQKIDDMRHAAYNGRGIFLSAKNPDQLSSSLSSAIASITDRTGSAAAVAVNSRSLNTNTRTYQARFTSGEWSGDLRAFPIDVTTGLIGSEVWSAKTQLMTQDWNTGRNILTRNSTQGIPFRWSTSVLTAAQQTALNTNPVSSTADGQGQARLEYLRGSTAEEGAGYNYRIRPGGFKLGDIVNSSPIFVGGPVFLPDGLETALHSSFRSTHINRTEMVYVGANDGMLHGFDAATGQEKVAYVPSMVFPNLNKLTDQNYIHQYYVDGSPTVGDAYGNFSNGCSSTACWRTVLVSGLNGGGKGVFALDVTDPSGTNISTLTFSESNAANIALWEFADSTTPDDMGYTYSQPTIARMKNGQWAAIFGNGYNSVNERPVLYIVSITDGTLIKKIILDTATGGSNGLSTPAVLDKDGDYIADYIYAGDLQGNMWKIDVTSTNSSSWDSFYKSGATPKPLFKATDGTTATTVVQPITERPEVSDHPDGQSGFMIYFGTGRYLADGDKTPVASPIQSFYGIWDKDSGGPIPTSDTAKVDRARLRSQTISTSTTIVAGQTVRTVTDDRLGNAGTTGTPQTWGDSGSACGAASGSCMGWVDNLLTNVTSPVNSLGEMSVSNPVLLGGATPRIIFTTLIPESSPCSAGGSSWLMELNPIHGGLLGVDVFGFSTGSTTITTVVGINQNIGIMPEPVIVRDPANKRDIKIVTGTTGAIQSIMNYPISSGGGRQSWRQLK
jgi:type IV pilus assembly protein PilY1